MDFEFTGFLYVDPCDLNEMCRLCEEQGLSPWSAVREVALGWDDYDYHIFEFVEGKIIAEVERRISKRG